MKNYFYPKHRLILSLSWYSLNLIDDRIFAMTFDFQNGWLPPLLQQPSSQTSSKCMHYIWFNHELLNRIDKLQPFKRSFDVWFPFGCLFLFEHFHCILKCNVLFDLVFWKLCSCLSLSSSSSSSSKCVDWKRNGQTNKYITKRIMLLQSSFCGIEGKAFDNLYFLKIFFFFLFFSLLIIPFERKRPSQKCEFSIHDVVWNTSPSLLIFYGLFRTCLFYLLHTKYK